MVQKQQVSLTCLFCLEFFWFRASFISFALLFLCVIQLIVLTLLFYVFIVISLKNVLTRKNFILFIL